MVTRGAAPRAVDATARLAREATESRPFRTAVLEVLRGSVGFDWFVWVLTDPVTSVGTDPLAHIHDLSLVPRTIRLKYATAVNRWTGLDRAAVLAGRAGESPLWSQVQRDAGVVDVMSAVFRDRFGCWGFLDLWSRCSYGAAELALVRELVPVITPALRRIQALTFREIPDARQPVTGPVVLLLDPDLRILGQTVASDAWLGLLLLRQDGSAPIPASAYNVAAQLLAQEQGIDPNGPSARVHLAGGLWATLRASRMQSDPGGGAGRGGSVAVIAETSTPAERLDLFSRAHGLSPRETELLGHLARGANTHELTRLMLLSRYTVQDHLTSIFAKTGVRGRRVLLAHALGVRSGAPP
jgi:DNA-binding CsgD family transcriptional regulator